MKLGTERVGVHKIDLEVDGTGKFSAEFNDQIFEAQTRKDLLEKLEKAVKKASQQGVVDVTVLGLVPGKKDKHGRFDDGPFEVGAGVVHAKLRARHEREYNAYLLVSEENQKFKVHGFDRGAVIARRLNDAEALRYLELKEAVRMAETDLEDFVGLVKLNPDDALNAARVKGGA